MTAQNLSPAIASGIRLAVLDMNGTTVVDGGAAERAVATALREAGVAGERLEAALAISRRSAGLDRAQVFERLFPDDGAAARAASRAFATEYDRMIGEGCLRAVPGAEATVHALREHGVLVALATGFGRHTQNSVLEALGWMGLADLSLCPEDAGRGRPFPDMVLTAVLALDIEDVRTVLVAGDTAADITSGLRAGAGAAVGVLTGAQGAGDLRAAGATAVVRSVADLPALLWGRGAIAAG
ncbi:HAD hydrolase-like protein [Sinomonas sp. JGH33]|uniref:HAD hydrolase-like protein n=1 Tax=Sinomonas terricola TaxID=3110330 RepID=A0ABU5TAH1_9MICC|nr:HAD family hydrolase [Sinomonas sp. JGH33]MEA5456461.1 HAD hydrolase-like protein [Sinomonas sp. JGH33]